MPLPPLTPNSADALLFDLGRVVINIDFDRALACWAGHAGCEPAHLSGRFSPDDAYKRHERGELSDAEYFTSLRASLGIDVSDAQFLEGWNAIFAGEMPNIAPLLARAARRLPLYAFSNTNRAHEAHFTQHFASVLGHLVKEIGVPAQRIVFFDDVMENIEGALARGLVAVHVTSTRDVAEALEALGI
jgi:FMN phosphatase YigB (HAD superfamily)